MAGRKKQPLSVIQGKGRSNHITKEEAKRRKSHEDKMKGSTDKVAPPDYLTKKQKEEFSDLADELMKLEIFSNLDIDQLARYIDSRDQYIRVTKALRTVKPVDHHIDLDTGKKQKNASENFDNLVRVRNKLFTECRQAATELGLSITSRLKLAIPDKEDNEPSEFEKKFGDI